MHNGLRHRIAIGKFVKEFGVKSYDHRSRMMTGMTYDCGYEQVARKFVHQEKSYYQTRMFNVNHCFKKNIPRNTTLEQMIIKCFLQWLTETGPRQRLMYQISYYMGCALTDAINKDSTWNFGMVCVYTNVRHKFDPITVPPWGKPCNVSRDCPGYFLYHTECKINLCFVPPRDYLRM
ncbi:SCP-like protein [Ostertagia ostertagi]